LNPDLANWTNELMDHFALSTLGPMEQSQFKKHPMFKKLSTFAGYDPISEPHQ
jgi:hypothetical protein